jgi:hypothetical protein
MSSISSAGKLSTILGMTAGVFLLDLFYMLYITAHGFELKPFTVAGLNIPIPVQWLPVFGMVFLAFVLAFEIADRIFPRRGLNVDQLGAMRLFRALVVSLVLFTCVLYIPYLIGSNWFWARLSDLSRNIPQVQGFSQAILNTDESAMTLNAVWQYAASQLAAALVLVLSGFALARVSRRSKQH